jgi:DOPA 4,5-dioxygenase
MALSCVSLRNSVPHRSSECLYFILDIYFHQRNEEEHKAALELRDAVLRLRRDGAFIAVPLYRVNTDPIGPHPCGKLRE